MSTEFDPHTGDVLDEAAKRARVEKFRELYRQMINFDAYEALKDVNDPYYELFLPTDGMDRIREMESAGKSAGN